MRRWRCGECGRSDLHEEDPRTVYDSYPFVCAGCGARLSRHGYSEAQVHEKVRTSRAEQGLSMEMSASQAQKIADLLRPTYEAMEEELRTPHRHRAFVEGCYRCDLSRFEEQKRQREARRARN